MAAPDRAKPVLIAGGGIGGLAAAIGLAQKGIPSIVLEKAASLGEIGAGIQLGPNAFHAFDYLGVGEAARSMAVYIDQLRLMDALTAQEIAHVDLGEAFRTRFGNPYAVVHRGDLHGVFLKGCQAHPLVELRVRSEVARLRSGRHIGHRAPCFGRARDGIDADRRRRAVVECAQTGRRRRSRRACPVIRPTVRSSRPSRCRRICAGTRPRCGPVRSATSFTIRSRAGKSSTWS